VIPTATSSGVGIAMKPVKLLGEGAVVRIAIDGTGEIANSVIAEPEGTPRVVRR
jgi:2-keto-4-pentenoate hydratase/2-oxohepta-3-ene-1,7-dioic acid hydratase in catechol pathway